MNVIQHLEISASAGSGKTYQLANRIIHLLALGVSVQSIICMTFTRKASAEFLDRVLLKLALATKEQNTKEKLQRELGVAQFDPLQLLEDLLTNLDKIHMNTLDSFFYKMLQQSALNMGFTSVPKLLDDQEWKEFQQEIINEVVRASSSEVKTQFFEAFKQASWGSENKGVEQKLAFFIHKNIDIYRKIPQSQYWANPDSIGWKNKDENQTIKCFHQALSILQNLPLETFLEKKQIEKWLTWCRELEKGIPTHTSSKKVLADFLNKIFTYYADLSQGKGNFAIAGKKAIFPAECCQALSKLTSAIFDYNLILKKHHTTGIYKIIQAYESLYKQRVLENGKLYHPDVAVFLQKTFASQASSLEELYYRMDQRFDHWLIDEFQDTSKIQWQILQPMIDEVIQDDNQQRSFFYVGDRKQSVYAWRGGEPLLFEKVHQCYGEKITHSHLFRSYRSSSVVLDFINRVFGNNAVIKNLFPTEAADLWNKEWKNHLSSKSKDYGEVGLHWVEEDSIWEILAEELHRINPLANSLSCAILLETNHKVKEVKQFLQQKLNYPITSEQKIYPLYDSLWVRSFFALWRAIEYPHDLYERRIVEMSPIFSSIFNLDNDWREMHEELQIAHQEGILANWIEIFWNKTKNHCHLQPIDHYCYRKIRTKAEELKVSFETLSQKRKKLESIQIETTQAKESIQIMTIHKAKGLGFDVVFLPFGMGTAQNSFTKGRGGISLQENPKSWVWDLPPLLYQKFTPELKKYQENIQSRACFESFCKWYVAMTRAKTHLYLIGSLPSSRSTALNLNRWLHQIFPSPNLLKWIGKNGSYPPRSFNPNDLKKSPDWEGIKDENTENKYPTANLIIASQNVHKNIDPQEKTQGILFKEILEKLDHYQSLIQLETTLSKILKKQKTSEAFASKIYQWIQKPKNQIPFLQISSDTIIWKEKTFEVFFQKQWIYGTFERVHWNLIQKNAIVYHFRQTCPKEDEMEKMQIQLKLYKRALSQLTSLEIERIDTTVIFLMD